jgi:succinate dehydrogenase / fumarate reductase membrane anchor subunit
MTTVTAGAAKRTPNRFETLAYRYMRISGLLIIPLVFGHLAIVHLINSVAVIDLEWVIETRWAYLGWRLYDAGLLWFTGLHGFNGLRVVINDYIHGATLNRILNIATALVMAVILTAGSIALIAAPFPGN